MSQQRFCFTQPRRPSIRSQTRTGFRLARRIGGESKIVAELNKRGIGSSDDGDLIRLLNVDRKAYAYDGDDPQFSGDKVEDIVERVAALVVAAEEAWSGG